MTRQDVSQLVCHYLRGLPHSNLPLLPVCCDLHWGELKSAALTFLSPSLSLHLSPAPLNLHPFFRSPLSYLHHPSFIPSNLNSGFFLFFLPGRLASSYFSPGLICHPLVSGLLLPLCRLMSDHRLPSLPAPSSQMCFLPTGDFPSFLTLYFPAFPSEGCGESELCSVTAPVSFLSSVFVGVFKAGEFTVACSRSDSPSGLIWIWKITLTMTEAASDKSGFSDIPLKSTKCCSFC